MKALLILAVLTMTIVLKAETGKNWFSEERSYRHHLFIDQKTCEKHQIGHMWRNCFQWLDLNPDGTAMVVLTDIANAATYEIIENRIIVHVDSGDAPPEMIFTMDHTGRNLILNDAHTIWELNQD